MSFCSSIGANGATSSVRTRAASGILAAALAVAIELALARPVARLSAAYDGQLQVGGLPPWLLLAVPVAAALLGWLGARLVSAWQLRTVA